MGDGQDAPRLIKNPRNNERPKPPRTRIDLILTATHEALEKQPAAVLEDEHLLSLSVKMHFRGENWDPDEVTLMVEFSSKGDADDDTPTE